MGTAKIEIYIVSHVWDNGGSYEDFQRYREDFLYSTPELAEKRVDVETYDNNYEGMWRIIKKTLNTQEETVLYETAYHKYFDFEDDEWYEVVEEEYKDITPENNVWMAFSEYEFEQNSADIEEYDIVQEWLYTPHDLYFTFKEIEEDKLNALNNELDTLINNN